MQTLATQLPLRLNPKEVYRLENFHFSQIEVKQAITEFCQLDSIIYLYLWGEQSSGKSHLLMAAVEHAQNNGKRALYLPLAELVPSTSPAVLESLEQLDLLCIDELEAVEGNTEWEEGIFHCFNRLQQSGCHLLIGSKHNPASSDIKLPDLRSRLATGLIYQLDSLDDTAKQQALIVQAQARGLELSEEVANYLLRHHSRDIRELINLLQILDKASMAAKRRLTIPFIRQVLNDG